MSWMSTMNAIVRVALQLIKCRFRYRRSLPCVALVFVVAVPVLLYFNLWSAVVPATRRDYEKLDRDLQLQNGAKLHPDVVLETALNSNTSHRKLQGFPSTISNCTNGEKDETECESTKKVDNGDGRATHQPYRHEAVNSTSLATTQRLVSQTTSNLSLPSHESRSTSLVIKGVLPRILVIYDNFSAESAKTLKVFLQAQRIDFDLYSTSKNRTPPPLSKFDAGTDEVIGRYALILSADIGILFNRLKSSERHLFYDYSREFNVSIVTLKRTSLDLRRGHVTSKFNYGRYLVSPVRSEFMTHVKVDDRRQWVFTKGGVTVTRLPPDAEWQIFVKAYDRQDTGEKRHGNVLRTNRSEGHLSLEFIQRSIREASLVNSNALVTLKYAMRYPNTADTLYRTSPIVLVDDDVIPGATTILIGMDMRFWLTKLVLLDVIATYAKTPLLRFDNKRYVMVDIDDIFIGPVGLMMTSGDVEVWSWCVRVSVCV